MKLHELHVDQLGASVVTERMAVSGALPTVAGDLIGAADTAGGDHDRFGPENLEPATVPVVTKRAHDAFLLLQQRQNSVLHVDVNTAVNAMVLQRANHFQPGAVPHVRQARILVPAKVALQDAAIRGAVEHRPPGFQFTHTLGRLLRVQLGHAPVVDILASAHGVGEVNLPVIALVHIRERGRDAAFGHDGVRFSEK